MNAAPPFPPFHPAAPAARWAAIADAARLVGGLAGLEDTAEGQRDGDIAALLHDIDGMRRELAEHALADLACVFEYGLAALLAANARGADPRPAARALWREYAAVRDALAALEVPAPDMASRRRSA